MIYHLDQIARDVRVAIDENQTNEQLITSGDIDTLSLDDIIKSKVAEAVQRIVKLAPVHLLDGGLPFGDAIYWKEQGAGWTLLPDDFIRLLIFKMSDWERPVYEPITAAHPQYQLQSSRYKGLRGNPQRPVVAIVRRAEGKALELYSCKSERATVEQALYLPLPKIDKDGWIDIPEQCYTSAVYMAAYLTLTAINQRELSTIMYELSEQLLV